MTKLALFAGACILAASSLAHASYPDLFTTAYTRGSVSASIAVVDEQGLTGVFARHTDGSIWNHVFRDVQPVNYPLRSGTTTLGVAAVVDPGDVSGADYVFTTEADGLWYLRVVAQGASWDHYWCHVDTTYDIGSAPSAIYIENGNIRVYARTTSGQLLQWRLQPQPNLCTQIAADRQNGAITSVPPVAVTLAIPGTHGRIDVFGVAHGRLAHWSKDESIDDRIGIGNGILAYEDLFYVDGSPNRAVNIQADSPVSVSQAMNWNSRTSRYDRRFDIAYRDLVGAVRRFGYDSNYGWYTDPNVMMGSSAAVFDIATARDRYPTAAPQLAWKIHGCFNTPTTSTPRCVGRYADGATSVIMPALFAANHVQVVRGYTDAYGNDWLFAVDQDTGNLRYVIGDY